MKGVDYLAPVASFMKAFHASAYRPKDGKIDGTIHLFPCLGKRVKVRVIAEVQDYWKTTRR